MCEELEAKCLKASMARLKAEERDRRGVGEGDREDV